MSGFPGLGDEFGPYSIVRLIGRGGMGVVFEARDSRLGRSVALKVLSPFLSEDDAFRARFTHEAGVLARLDSPHVVQIHEYGEIDGCLYLTAQLVPGGDLEQYLLEKGSLDPVSALELTEQVCEALVDAHEVGVVHRDIKPSNILLRRRGTGLHAFLCDFGIATTGDSQHTRTGQVVGSPLYMAPERHRGGRADIRGDIYAVGCVLWRMLTGLHPYPGNDVQVGMAHLHEPIPQLSGSDAVSRQVNALLARALAKEPADRFQNPNALRAAVAEALTLARALAGPASTSAPVARTTSRASARRARAGRGAEPTVGAGLRLDDITEVRHLPGQRVPPVAAPGPDDEGSGSDRTVVEVMPGAPARPRRPRILVAAGLALALVVGGGAALLARGSDKPTAAPRPERPTASSSSTPAVPKVIRPSDMPGGTVRMAVNGLFQDGMVDPGGLYATYEWNLSRLYARTLMMVDPAPHAPGHDLVPDLATGPGRSDDGGLTWTYTLRRGLTYEDGSPIVAKDVRHAVLRSANKTNFPDAPIYFRTLLRRPLRSAITTRGPREITFHMAKPFADFDHLAQLPQTAPVPRDRDDADYKQQPLSSGPYRFEGKFDPEGDGFTLVRNRKWSRSVDPHRTALPNRFVIHTVAADVRAEVLAGTRDLDLGEGTATVASIKRVREAGGVADVSFGDLAYATISPDVGHLDDLNCRRAVAYAVDHAAVQEAYSISDQNIGLATTILPPGMPGRSAQFDAFGVRSHPDGDLDQARRALDACGQPGGFRFKIAYQGDDRKAAKAISAALKRVGVTTSLLHEDASDGVGLETGKCSNQEWRKLNHVGMCLYAWSPDWQDGYGMLEPLVDSNARSAEGASYNFSVDRGEVDALINQALSSPKPEDRDTLWAQVDAYVVEQALIIPTAYIARLLVRPPGLTNLWVNPSFGAYDYAAVGVVDGGKS